MCFKHNVFACVRLYFICFLLLLYYLKCVYLCLSLLKCMPVLCQKKKLRLFPLIGVFRNSFTYIPNKFDLLFMMVMITWCRMTQHNYIYNLMEYIYNIILIFLYARSDFPVPAIDGGCVKTSKVERWWIVPHHIQFSIDVYRFIYFLGQEESRWSGTTVVW